MIVFALLVCQIHANSSDSPNDVRNGMRDGPREMMKGAGKKFGKMNQKLRKRIEKMRKMRRRRKNGRVKPSSTISPLQETPTEMPKVGSDDGTLSKLSNDVPVKESVGNDRPIEETGDLSGAAPVEPEAVVNDVEAA